LKDEELSEFEREVKRGKGGIEPILGRDIAWLRS
jgi:hypothetical protein